MQTLRTLYLYGILSPLGLFMARRSVLKRASQWLLKQTIMSSSSRDISDLVIGNLVTTNYFEIFLVLFERSSLGLSVAI